MTEVLIVPEEIPVLDEVDFESLEIAIGLMRQAAGHIQQRSGEIDANWVAGVAVHYLTPDGANLSEKVAPVKQKGGEVAEVTHASADGLQGYVNEGAPIKQGLKQVRREADALVAKAKPQGPAWQDNPELVAENQRLKARAHQLVTAHEEAQQSAVRHIGTTNTLATTSVEGVSDHVGLGAYPVAGLSAATEWRTRYRYGRFAPRGYYADGRYGYLSVKNAPWWKNTYRRMFTKNWQAKPHMSAKYSKWTKIGKVGGVAGGALSAATSGLNQWSQDQVKHPNMSTGERGVRAGAKALGSGAGAMAGAKLGASTGAAVGALFGGVGAPVGAAVGGIIGAATGSQAGSWLADKFNSWFSDED